MSRMRINAASEFPNQFTKVMSVSLDGTFLMCQALAWAVRDDTGTPRAVVKISSVAGIMGVPNRLS